MKTFLLSLFVLTAILLAACGNQSSPAQQPTSHESGQAESAGIVELEYFIWNDEESYLSTVVDRFNALDNGIQVSLTSLPPNDYNVRILTMLTAGADFDLFGVNGVSQLFQYATNGGLYDMTDMIGQSDVDVSAYGPSFMELAIDGRWYILPYRTTAYALFYNKDIFDEAGIPHPSEMTWEAYAELALELTTGEGGNRQWGGFIPDWMFAPLSAIQRQSNFLDDDITAIEEWLLFLDRIYNIDNSHMSFAQMQIGNVDWIRMFESGTVAMLPNGEWTISMLNESIARGETDINFGVTFLPRPADISQNRSPGGVSTFIAIHALSPNPQEAFAFAQYLTSSEGAMILAEHGVLPAYTSSEIAEAFVLASGVDGANVFLALETYLETQPVHGIEEVLQLYQEEKEMFLVGEQSIEETMRNFTEGRASIFERARP